jgi:hypothetical protein
LPRIKLLLNALEKEETLILIESYCLPSKRRETIEKEKKMAS